MAAIERAYRAEMAEFSCTLANPSAGNEVVQVIKACVAVPANPGAQRRAIDSEEASTTRASRGEASLGAAIGHHSISAGQPAIVESASLGSGERATAVPQQAGLPTLQDGPCEGAARKRRARRRGHWTSMGAGALIPSLIAANLGLIGWRADLVSLLPQTASFYAESGLPVNVTGVTFDDFSAKTEFRDAGLALVLEGRLLNVAHRAVRLPQLRFSLRNDEGREVYAWTEPPPKASLAPGEVLRFGSRLASPPERGKEVIVRLLGSGESYSTARNFPPNAAAGAR
jgi:hypothetical protein